MYGRIIELGNGFPDVGDLVTFEDAGATCAARVTAVENHIHTGSRPGAGNWIYGKVERVYWVDVPSHEEPVATFEEV